MAGAWPGAWTGSPEGDCHITAGPPGRYVCPPQVPQSEEYGNPIAGWLQTAPGIITPGEPQPQSPAGMLYDCGNPPQPQSAGSAEGKGWPHPQSLEKTWCGAWCRWCLPYGA